MDLDFGGPASFYAGRCRKRLRDDHQQPARLKRRSMRNLYVNILQMKNLLSDNWQLTLALVSAINKSEESECAIVHDKKTITTNGEVALGGVPAREAWPKESQWFGSPLLLLFVKHKSGEDVNIEAHVRKLLSLSSEVQVAGDIDTMWSRLLELSPKNRSTHARKRTMQEHLTREVRSNLLPTTSRKQWVE